MMRGYLYGAVSRLTCSCSSRTSSGGGRVAAVAQHDDGAHDRAALLVGRRDGRGLGDGRVGDERRLDLERADAIAGGDDHVVVAPLEAQPAVLVLLDQVARAPGAAVAAVIDLPRAVLAAPHVLAEVAEEERRHASRGSSISSPSLTSSPTPGSGLPIEPGRAGSPGGGTGQLAGLGLPVAVADLEARRLVPGAQHLRVERLAGGDHRAQRRAAAQSVARLAITRYSVGAMQSTLTRSRASSSRRSCGSKRASCSSAAAPAQPGRDEHVARRLRPAARGRAPDELARARRRASARPAGAGRAGSAGACTTAFGSPAVPLVKVIRQGSCARELGGRRGSAAYRRLVGDEQRPRTSGAAASSSARLRSSATISAGAATSMRRRRSLARSCSVHGSTTAPMRKHATIASTHSGRLPISVITTSPRPTPERCEGARQPRRALGDLAEAPLASRAVARELDQREAPAGAASTTRGRSSRRYSPWTRPKTTLERETAWP